MSRLAPGLIELNKGLDLNTAKIAAPEGTLLDSLNYEQVDFQGQKRIDGYVRYDGSKGSYIDDFLRIEGASGTPGDIVHLSSSGELGAEGKLFGIVVGSSDGSMDVAVIDETLIPKLSAAHTWGTKAAGLTPDEHYELILLYNQVLRERTTSLPGPVAGLHWFRDRLYAVASVPTVEGSGFPNETWNGYPILKSKDGILSLGTAEDVGEPSPDMASFFESRDEAQAEAELGSPWLYGWEFNHLGWKVPFENGISLYGQLIALNLNRQNLTGINATDTSGGNGRALSVIQNVPIEGLPPQVNGWKQSDTPTSYNIRPEFIENIDDDFLYADAYISWEEDGTVNMQTTNLQNRPANATVEVVI